MSLQNQIHNINRGIGLLEKYSLDGELQPHEAYVLLKESGIVDYYNEVLSKVKDSAIEVLRNNFLDPGKQTFKDSDYAYTVKAGPTRYYFTDVEEHKQAQADLKNSDAYQKIKAVEQKYKTAFLLAQKQQSIVDEETGELVDPSKVKVVYNPASLSIRKLK